MSYGIWRYIDVLQGRVARAVTAGCIKKWERRKRERDRRRVKVKKGIFKFRKFRCTERQKNKGGDRATVNSARQWTSMLINQVTNTNRVMSGSKWREVVQYLSLRCYLTNSVLSSSLEHVPWLIIDQLCRDKSLTKGLMLGFEARHFSLLGTDTHTDTHTHTHTHTDKKLLIIVYSLTRMC